MNFIRIAIVALFALGMVSCSTIELKEQDAFDVKRTISPAYFSNGPAGIEVVHIPVTDSLALNGWFISHDSAVGTVLYFGGNGFVMVTSFDIIKSIVDRQVNLLVFDYRGYGENPGTPTVAGLKADGLAAYNFLVQKKGIRPEQLVIHGHSLGSFVASTIARQQSSAGMVLECPITDAKDWTGRLIPWFLKPFIRFKIDPALLENSNTENVKHIRQPTLILAGGADKVTPPGMAEKVFQASVAAGKRLLIIENGGHNDLPKRTEYVEALMQFYQRILPPSTPTGE